MSPGPANCAWGGDGSDSAELDEGGEPMHWYTVRLVAPDRIRTLQLRATLLFEIFSDQRNVVQVIDATTDKRTSFYFARGDTTTRSVAF